MRNNLLLIVLCGLLAVGGCGGCGLVGGLGYVVLRRDTAQHAQPQSLAGEAAYWSALADFARDHPERFEDTDRVYKIAAELQALGCVSSLERLARWKDRVEPISDANRDAVLAALSSH